jgi:hypothetical protein
VLIPLGKSNDNLTDSKWCAHVKTNDRISQGIPTQQGGWDLSFVASKIPSCPFRSFSVNCTLSLHSRTVIAPDHTQTSGNWCVVSGNSCSPCFDVVNRIRSFLVLTRAVLAMPHVALQRRKWIPDRHVAVTQENQIVIRDEGGSIHSCCFIHVAQLAFLRIAAFMNKHVLAGSNTRTNKGYVWEGS